MNDPCLVCGNREFSRIYKDLLLRCRSCGFITSKDKISDADLKNIYTKEYFNGKEYSDYPGDKKALQKNFTNRLNYICKHVAKTDIRNALEIGCAYGFFAETFTSGFNNSKYKGCDISEEAVAYGKIELNQNLVAENYLETDPPVEKYTDVFMWDTIEHLPEPDTYIQKISEEIDRGGRLYITTGDIDRFVPRMLKEKWRLIHPPTHLHYFSKKTISILLEKNGFEITDISYPSVYRSFRLIFHSLFMLGKHPGSFAQKIYQMIPAKWKVPMNMYDILFVIATKK